MSFYAVSKYADQIRKKKEEDGRPTSMYLFFDSENEARSFIRKRSYDAYLAAEEAVEKARKRHNRNCKKFPPIKASPNAALLPEGKLMNDCNLKFVSELHFEHSHSVRANAGHTLQFEQTYHGDRDEHWIIERDALGKEVARHNARHVTSIVWA